MFSEATKMSKSSGTTEKTASVESKEQDQKSDQKFLITEIDVNTPETRALSTPLNTPRIRLSSIDKEENKTNANFQQKEEIGKVEIQVDIAQEKGSSLDSKKSFSEEKQKKFLQCRVKTFKKNRDYQSEQEAVMLILLNKFFDITLKKPQKIKCESQPFFKVLTLSNGTDIIDVEDYVQRRCTEIEKQDLLKGINFKTAERRKFVNRNVEVLHLLNDILLLKGFTFESRTTTGNRGVVKETLTNIQYGRFCLRREKIADVGRKINLYLSDIIAQHKGTVTIRKGDKNLSSFFNF